MTETSAEKPTYTSPRPSARTRSSSHERHPGAPAMRLLGQRCGGASHYEAPVHAIDVLADPAIRQAIKAYSGWPTIPQLYVNGTFAGGCDIVREMHANRRTVGAVHPQVIPRPCHERAHRCRRGRCAENGLGAALCRVLRPRAITCSSPAVRQRRSRSSPRRSGSGWQRRTRGDGHDP